MNAGQIERQFARIGARAVVRRDGWSYRIDVIRDERGGYFDIALPERTPMVTALDVQPARRHLLLAIGNRGAERVLCGHDERDWFAAAIPPVGGVASVRAAMDALMPAEVRRALDAAGVRGRNRHRRRNAAFVRQGEWFFLPEPEFDPDPLRVLRNERISRGRGKPHLVEYVCRAGGEAVYVSHEYPQGISEVSFRALIGRRPEKARQRWVSMRRNPRVFGRGRVRHPDHKTIELDVWHRVLMNAENQAPAMRHLAFLD